MLVSVVVAGLNVVKTEVMTVGRVDVQVEGFQVVVDTTLATGFVLVCMIVEYTAEQVEEVHGTVLPYWTGWYACGA